MHQVHSRHGLSDLLRSRVPERKTQYTTRDLSGTDGQADSLEAARKEGGPLLSQGPERPTMERQLPWPVRIASVKNQTHRQIVSPRWLCN